MNLNTVPVISDEDAIQSLLESEIQAFHARDFELWASHYVQDARARDIVASQERGMVIMEGWDAIADAMRTLMEENPKPGEHEFIVEDMSLTVSGDMAWATYRHYCQPEPESSYSMPDKYETKVFERHDGRWLIALSSFAVLRQARADVPLIQVDGKGKVKWATKATLDRLAEFEGLTISHGRLRAMTPAFDKPLQETFRRASELCQVWISEFGGKDAQFSYPTILGESSSGGTLHCLVFVQDGMINVRFGDEALVEGKIAAASEVFGLSKGQRTLAIELSSGLGLTEAAESLGISINTARTHLGRIYAKTGVNSQVALVRLFMSQATLR